MRVAITGGIAEGKSTVLAHLRDLGYRTASADEFARQVFGQVQEELAAVSGLSLPVSPKELRTLMATNADLRREVNRIMHPLIHRKLEASTAEFMEVPLLFEACIYGLFERVWVVTCGLDEQRRRLVERYGEGAHVDSMLATQLPSRVKSVFSDRIIRTNEAPETVSRLLSEAVTALYGS